MSWKNTIAVDGMTCGHCAAAIASALEGLDAVRDVVADVATGRVTYEADRSDVEAAVASAVREAGYGLASSS